MKKALFLLLLAAFGSLSASAQDSTSTRLGLQHTIAPILVGSFYSGPGITYGVQYDLRFRTPNKWLDYAVGIESSYKRSSERGIWNSTGTQKTDYNYAHLRNTLYGAVLLGKKDWSFETGVQATVYSDLYYSKNYIMPINPSRDTIINYFERNTHYLALGVPLGVRYQPAKSSFYASLLMDFSFE